MTETITQEASIESTVSRAEGAPIQVLHVDDEPDFLKAAKQILEMQGTFKVDIASSVEEASEKMKQKIYDAIVCDYIMPRKDGLQFLKELRDSGNNIPFIIFTGKGREEVAIEALNLGADRYLSKIGGPETVYGELAHGIRQVVERAETKEVLIESEERYRNIVELSPESIITVDPKGVITSCNAATTRMLGYSEDEMIGKHFAKLEAIQANAIPQCLELFSSVLKGNVTKPLELTFYRKDGTPLIAEVRVGLLKKGRKTMGLQAICIDITERKRAEQELLKSEEKFRNIFENANDCMAYLDRSGRILDVNRKAVEVFGGSKRELLGKHFARLGVLSVRDLPKVMSAFARALAGKKTTYATCIKNKKGREIHVEVSGVPMRAYGKPAGLLVVARDMTEHRQAEITLRESEEKWRSLVELAPDIIVTSDLKGVITSFNAAGVRISGYSKAEVVGKHFSRIGHIKARDLPKFLKLFESVMKGRITKPLEVTLYRKDGAPRLVEAHVGVLKHKGKTVGVQAILRDITERKKVEQASRETEERYRDLVELAPDGIVTVNLKGMITSINPAFSKLTGYSKDEIVGTHFTRLRTIRARDLPKYLKLFSSFFRGKAFSPFEFVYLHKDGTQRWGEAHASLLEKHGRKIGAQAILRDITERKRSREALRRSEEQARYLLEFRNKLIDTAIVLIDVVDKEGNITLWNRAAELITGYSREEVIGHKKLWEWLYPDPKYRTEILRWVKKTIETGESRENFQATIRCKDGTLKTLSWYSTSILDEKGRSIGLIGAAIDITERKKAEEELKMTLEKLKILNEKLGVVGKLTRHDARNKLSTISMNAFLTKQKLANDHEALELLSQIESTCGAVERIFNFARIYEKLGIEELVYMDVEKSLGEAVKLFPDLQRVKVVNICHGLTALTDSLLRQLFYNLIDNSLKHGGKVSQIRVYYEETGKEHLKLVYEDDGVGIPKAEKQRIFREGYGKDTGYGLYLIRKMCDVYGWTIRETGKHGKGAQFTITIPKMSQNGKENYRL